MLSTNFGILADMSRVPQLISTSPSSRSNLALLDNWNTASPLNVSDLLIHRLNLITANTTHAISTPTMAIIDPVPRRWVPNVIPKGIFK